MVPFNHLRTIIRRTPYWKRLSSSFPYKKNKKKNRVDGFATHHYASTEKFFDQADRHGNEAEVEKT
jgi:hypothetical protein